MLSENTKKVQAPENLQNLDKESEHTTKKIFFGFDPLIGIRIAR